MESLEMKARNMGVVALAVWMTMGAVDAKAQSRRGEQGEQRRRGLDVEAVMALRDRLELTEDQLGTLEELRAERVVERSALNAEMSEMRSLLRAGQIPRSEMMAFMEARQEASAGVAEERREQIDAVLDETQREALEEMRVRTRSFARGRASARRNGRRGFERDRGRRAPPPEMRRLPGDDAATPLEIGPR